MSDHQPPWLVLFWILLGIFLLMVIIIVLCILLSKNRKPSKSDKLYNDIFNPSPSTVIENASKKYFDVIFCTNDSKKVFGHRCILFTFSDIFEALFNEETNIPIEIEVDFPESIVSRAIEFCYGKIDGIQGFEDELIEFAEKYSIKGLKEACFESYETQDVTIENICPLASAAFKYNLTSLKQDCLYFIIGSNVEISHKEFSELPVEFLVFIAKKYIARYS